MCLHTVYCKCISLRTAIFSIISIALSTTFYSTTTTTIPHAERVLAVERQAQQNHTCAKCWREFDIKMVNKVKKKKGLAENCERKSGLGIIMLHFLVQHFRKERSSNLLHINSSHTSAFKFDIYVKMTTTI